MFDLPVESILKDFYENEHFFTQEDFLYFADFPDDKKMLGDIFIQDPEFIKLFNGDLLKNYFISKKTILKWYLRLSLRMAEIKNFRLNQNQLATVYSFLFIHNRFKYPPSQLVSFGEYYGFIEEMAGKNGQYIFPIAYLLSFMNGQKASLAVNRTIEKISLTKSIKNINFRHLAKIFFMEGWLQLKNRERYIVKSREGLFSGKKLTLEAIGKVEKITRERVRQIEQKAWKRLQHPSRSNIFAAALICTTIVKQGSLVHSADSIESLLISFLAKCSNVPISNLQNINKVIVGNFIEKFNITNSEFMNMDFFNSQSLIERISSENSTFLIREDLQNLSVCISEYYKKILTITQKVYIALKEIGKPAHTSRITEMYNSLFPNSPSTEYIIHNRLTDEKYGIVWIGIRSTFSLKEWGYEHPSLTLFDTVKRIVKSKFEDTNQPVPFNIIVSEMGRYRRIVNRNSLVIASHYNPDLQRIGQNSFIPKGKAEKIQEKDNFEDKLDRVLKEMEG